MTYGNVSVTMFVVTIVRKEMTGMGTVFIQWHTCPRCRWTRFYDTRPHIRYAYYDHPIYGRVSGETLVHLDIVTHDCEAAAAAHNRAIQRKLRETIQGATR